MVAGQHFKSLPRPKQGMELEGATTDDVSVAALSVTDYRPGFPALGGPFVVGFLQKIRDLKKII